MKTIEQIKAEANIIAEFFDVRESETIKHACVTNPIVNSAIHLSTALCLSPMQSMLLIVSALIDANDALMRLAADEARMSTRIPVVICPVTDAINEI